MQLFDWKTYIWPTSSDSSWIVQVPRARDTEFEEIVVDTMENEPLGLVFS